MFFGVALIGLSELFPHWSYFDPMTSGRRPAGYHFFTEKPEVKGRGEVFGTDGMLDLTQRLDIKRDGLRTLLQRLLISLFTLARIILFKDILSLGWKVLSALIICLSLPLFLFWLNELHFEYWELPKLISQ